MLSSKTNALLTHTLASFWRKQSCNQILIQFTLYLERALLRFIVMFINNFLRELNQNKLSKRHIIYDSTGRMWSAKSGLDITSWWRHQMETFSALEAICAGNSPMFSLICTRTNGKQSIRRWFETPSRSLWCHCNVPGYRHHYKGTNDIRYAPNVIPSNFNAHYTQKDSFIKGIPLYLRWPVNSLRPRDWGQETYINQ